MALVAYNPHFGGYDIEQNLLDKIREIAPKDHISHTHKLKYPASSERMEKEYYRYELSQLIERHDPYLTKAIQLVGEKESFSSNKGTSLAVIEVERGYRIDEYDGKETVHHLGNEWTVIRD